jgi:hypothetical protein
MANPKAKIHLVYKKERKIKARVQIATHESNRKQAAQSLCLGITVRSNNQIESSIRT